MGITAPDKGPSGLAISAVSPHRDPAPAAEEIPVRARPYLLVAELPTFMADLDSRREYRPLFQFIKDWNSQEAVNRATMITDPPPVDADATTAAKIAAVVHALCDRDHHPVPGWVRGLRAPYDTALVSAVGDLDSGYGLVVREESPLACSHHRVWFPADTLDTT